MANAICKWCKREWLQLGMEDKGPYCRAESAERQLAACEEERDGLQGELKSVRLMLLNLLAVVHRDGGQYAEEHGESNATNAAIAVWGKLITDSSLLSSAEGEMDGLRELLHDIMGNIGEMGPSGPCPVCWTWRTHKGWCWYEKARALRGAGEEG